MAIGHSDARVPRLRMAMWSVSRCRRLHTIPASDTFPLHLPAGRHISLHASTQPHRPNSPTARADRYASLCSPEPLLKPVTCFADEHEQFILRNNDHLHVEASGFLTQDIWNLSFRHEQL